MYTYTITTPNSLILKIEICAGKVSLYPSANLFHLALVAFVRLNSDICISKYSNRPQHAILSESEAINAIHLSKPVEFYLSRSLDAGGLEILIDRLLNYNTGVLSQGLSQSFGELVHQYKLAIGNSVLDNFSKFELLNHIATQEQGFNYSILSHAHDCSRAVLAYHQYQDDLSMPSNLITKHSEIFTLLDHAARNAIHITPRPYELTAESIESFATTIRNIRAFFGNPMALSYRPGLTGLHKRLVTLLAEDNNLELFSALIRNKPYFVPELRHALTELKQDLERHLRLTQKPWYVTALRACALPLAALISATASYRNTSLVIGLFGITLEKSLAAIDALKKDSYDSLKKGLRLESEAELASFNQGVDAALSTSTGFFSMFSKDVWRCPEAYYGGKAAKTLGDIALIVSARRRA